MEENFKKCLEEFFDDNENEKVIFIGAGFSKNLGLPTWEEFAYIHLNILKDIDEIDFETYELLKKDNFRTIISMTKDIIVNNDKLRNILFKEYEELFRIDCKKINSFDNNLKLSDLSNDDFDEILNIRTKFKRLERVKNKEDIFSLVYNLNLINVTTNYDDILDILAYEQVKEFSKTEKISFKTDNKDKKVFYSENDFKTINRDTSLIKAGGVYHIHGSVNDINNMIVSNEDYIRRYWSGENPFKDFIKNIFDKYNVIFLGYSLQELEILNYLFEGEKGLIQKTNKKRIMLLDHFDYEKSKLKFLSNYYFNNYGIKLCPYSKSKKGFNILVDIIKNVSNIKNEVEKKKIGYKRCIELIKKDSLEETEKTELLDKLKLYKDLQSEFFKMIDSNYKYLDYISQKNYFDVEIVNIEALIEYMNSIYSYIDKIDKKNINKVFIFLKKCIKKNQYIPNYDFILFILRYRSKIDNFNLEELLDFINTENFNSILLSFLIRCFNEEYIFEFFKENYKVIFNLIIKYIINDINITYSISENSNLLNYLLDNPNFLCNIIDLYEKSYIKIKSEDENLKVSLEKEILLIKSKNDDFKSFNIKFDNLKNIYDEIDKRSINVDDSIKKSIRNLLNENSYLSIFDNLFYNTDSMNYHKIKLLLNISKSEKYKTDLIEKLFQSKVYYLKKISLYLIVKNNMVEYLIEKINNNNFDLEYMIRNNEFAGEIKECFKLLNNYERKDIINAEILLNMIKKGEYFIYEDEDNKLKVIWKYKRFKLLTKFKNISYEFDNLKDKVDYDYELNPIMKFEVGSVKRIPSIDLKKAIKMNINDWVNHMNINNYQKINPENFLIEYEIEEDVKIFIECLKANLDSYMTNINLLSNLENYEGLYYIFRYLEEIIKDDDTFCFSQYYKKIVSLINSYLDKLNDIYEKPPKNSISKKHLVCKMCELLTSILEKIDVSKFKKTYKEIIRKLENKISNKNDFKRIFAGKNDNYTSFINSVHQNILRLEVIFSLKLKDLVDEKVYIKNLIYQRMNKSEKEFFIFLGEYTYTFMNIDKDLVTDIIKNIDTDLKKEMFLIGLSYNKVINENQYNLIKPIILYLCENQLKYNNVVSNIVKYDILAFLLGYKEANLELIKQKHNLSRESIFYLFNLKETCKKLNNKYDEKEYQYKIIIIWNSILNLDWTETEFDVIEATISALENFDSINEEIVTNIKNLLEHIPESVSISFKLCEYLEKVLNLENLDYIIQIMKSYKPGYGDRNMIKICNIIKSLSEKKFKEFADFWILKNKNQSELKSYLIYEN